MSCRRASVFPCISVWLRAAEMHLNEALYLQIPLQLKATGGQTCVSFCRKVVRRLCSVDEHVSAHAPPGVEVAGRGGGGRAFK